MKLDPIDLLILTELAEDGRASFRQIARRASLSTPTVSSRFDRMMHAGLIQKFIPVFNLDAAESFGIVALVTLSAPVSMTSDIAKKLARMPEVFGVFVATGENNIVVKISLHNAYALQHFLIGPTFRKLGVEVTGSQIITETVKDEHPLPFAEEFQIELRCDLCKEEITSSRPYSIRVGSTRHYFCCRPCRKSYLDKYGPRIKRVNQLSENESD